MAVKGKKRRPPGGKSGPRPPRRKLPPEATGEERTWLQRVKEARTPLTVHLLDGRRVDGVIEYFDRDMIKITRPEGPHFFVRKAEIRYVEESKTG